MKRNQASLMRSLMGPIALFVALFLLGNINPIAVGATEQQELVDKSQVTLGNFVSDPNMEWLVKNVQNAKAALIVPSMIKGGFFLGGSGGRGCCWYGMRRPANGTDPAFTHWGL